MGNSVSVHTYGNVTELRILLKLKAATADMRDIKTTGIANEQQPISVTQISDVE